ncbi:MAG: hypothetical protein IKE43_05955 [Coriobacteriales bacterium]|nr:hypothetical protein [Coriobacteriales bacterium]
MIDELEQAFDKGEDLTGFFDFDNPIFPNRELKRVNVDFPLWMITALDNEANRIGVNRQAIIKIWLAERLDSLASA